MNDAPKAVFLSYAREDTDAARRIADALRSQGIEAWFDQSELRGGDAWDAKIRKQIRECALFMPVISEHTQERGEGYFRLEWKLAVERTHLMAEGVPFLAPLVVDGTAESGAIVPAEFMRVQWTRLPGGLPTPQFVDQVKRLLEAPRKAVPTRSGNREVYVPEASRAGGTTGRSDETPARSATRRTWAIAAGAAIAIGVGATFLSTRKTPAPAPVPGPQAGMPAPSSLLAAPAAPAAPAPAAPAKSLAVLPFANLSTERENEFFADGMHDEVITALAKIRDLTVISRTSVMAYKKSEGRNLRRIAAELGVASVLEGSVQRAGNKVKVIVQLIDARTDRHLWADTYVEDLTDVFTIQSKLASAITLALKATLSPEEKSRIARRPTQDQEAYDLYLRARAMGESVGTRAERAPIERVIALYDQAVVRDPGFVLAHVQSCYFNGMMYWFGTLDSSPERRARAKAGLDAALRLAPNLAETRLAQGAYLYLCENDWEAALREFRAAEAGMPGEAQIHYLIGIALRRLGRHPEAFASFARSVELNPRDFTTPPQQMVSLRALHRFAELRDLATHYLKVFPETDVLVGHLSVGQFELDGDRAAYLRRLESAPAGANDTHGLLKAYRLALARGDLAAAETVLTDPRLTSIPGSGGILNDPVALHRAGLAFFRGDRAKAQAQAEAAIAAFGAMSPVKRQEPYIGLGTALASALAGREDEAVRLARANSGLALARDAFATDARHALARVYLVLDRRDEAFACLREMMVTPTDTTPQLLRLDHFWSRVKDDPRFEEILKTMKPL